MVCKPFRSLSGIRFLILLMITMTVVPACRATRPQPGEAAPPFFLQPSGSAPSGVESSKDDLVRIELKDGRRHQVPSTGGPVFIKRKGNTVQIVSGKKTRVLQTIDEELHPATFREDPFLMTADVDFDGRPEFFLVDAMGASNICYKIVDLNGRDQAEKLFSKTALEANGAVLCMPSFDARQKRLSTWEKSGPVGAEIHYAWSDAGRYDVMMRAEPIICHSRHADDNDGIFHKVFLYDGDIPIREYLSGYGDFRPLLLHSNREMPALTSPVSSAVPSDGGYCTFQSYTGHSWGRVGVSARPEISFIIAKDASLDVLDLWADPDSRAEWFLVRHPESGKLGWIMASLPPDEG